MGRFRRLNAKLPVLCHPQVHRASNMDLFWSVFLLLLPLLLIFVGTKRPRLHRPLPLPLIGHLHLLSSPAHHSLARLSALYGQVLPLRFGSRRVLLVSSSAAAEECFATLDLSFSDRPPALATKHFNYNGTSLATAPYGPRWRNLRRMATVGLLSSSRLSMFADLRGGKVRALVGNLFSTYSGSSSSPTNDWFLWDNIRAKLAETTLETLMAMIVGKRYQVEDKARFAHIVDEIFELSNVMSLEECLPFMSWMGMSAMEKRMCKLEKEVDGLMQNMVDARRREIVQELGKCSNEDLATAKKPLLDSMLSLQEEDPVAHTDETIKAMIQVLVLAGTHTTSITMEWTMALLLNHPYHLQQVHAEIEAKVGHGRLVADSDLPNLHYLSNVVKETLRLKPSSPLLVARECVAECKVQNIHVQPGTMLLVNAYAIHRDPKVWTDPTEFRPSRFEAGGEGGGGYKYLPFGGGRRLCPGESLALRTVGLTIASLVQCFEWKRVGEGEVDLSEGEVVSMPMATPLRALCKPRQAMIDVLSQLSASVQ